METLLVATRNRHKTGEIQKILGSWFRCVSLVDLARAPEVAETADTFRGNATLKAVALARWLAGPARELPLDGADIRHVLADDSGLEVDALNGAPGVHSARVAALDTGQAGNSTDAANNAKLLRLLADVPLPRRTARFRCALALTPVPEPAVAGASPACSADACEFATLIFEGVCEGNLRLAPSGQGGFGYDPLFVPLGHTASFAELGEETKNEISHRAQALASLKAFLGRR